VRAAGGHPGPLTPEVSLLPSRSKQWPATFPVLQPGAEMLGDGPRKRAPRGEGNHRSPALPQLLSLPLAPWPCDLGEVPTSLEDSTNPGASLHF
jgi:hypothetical protein